MIFDYDGVLVDSELSAAAIDQRVFAEFGWHLTTDEMTEHFMSKSATSFTSELGAHLGYRLPDDWDVRYTPWYLEASGTSLRSIDGIEAALESVTVQTCIASSGTHEKIRQTLGLTPQVCRCSVIPAASLRRSGSLQKLQSFCPPCTITVRMTRISRSTQR